MIPSERIILQTLWAWVRLPKAPHLEIPKSCPDLYSAVFPARLPKGHLWCARGPNNQDWLGPFYNKNYNKKNVRFATSTATVSHRFVKIFLMHLARHDEAVSPSHDLYSYIWFDNLTIRDHRETSRLVWIWLAQGTWCYLTDLRKWLHFHWAHLQARLQIVTHFLVTP